MRPRNISHYVRLTFDSAVSELSETIWQLYYVTFSTCRLLARLFIDIVISYGPN